MSRALVLLGLSALAAAALLLRPATGAPLAASRSPLYPEPAPALRFSHARHAALGVECLRCHAGARASRSAVDLLLPTEATCRECHRIDRAAPSVEACGACHRSFSAAAPVVRVSALPPALKHSHAAHAALPCQRCHAPSSASGFGDTPALPAMVSCLSCHRELAGATRCTECHLAAPSGRIDTTLGFFAGAPNRPSLRPRGALFGDGHGPGFANDHRAAAARAEPTCGACHDDSFCSDCHAGVVRPLSFHPDDYLGVHAIEARRAVSECSTCHRVQSFCVGCHERVGVSARAAAEWTPSQPFHPLGWAASERGPTQNRHAREARRNVSACASCHREDECLPCHGADAGGLAISPHPSWWRGSTQCRALDRANRRMCLRCHVTEEEVGCDFRGRR